MRRSSWLILIAAFVLLAAAAVLYIHSFNTTASAITPRVVESIIERGKSALERRDVNGIMDLMSPNARIMDLNPDQMRLILNRSMKELGASNLTITWKNVTVRPLGDTAEASFDLNVGQKTTSADISYYQTHIDLQLEKVVTSHWFGLYKTQDWKILRATSDKSLDVPGF